MVNAVSYGLKALRRSVSSHFESGAGGVVVGDDARIGPGVHVYAFDHVFDDADVPVKDQGVRSVGVVVGADVWIGANACVLGAFCYHTGPRTTASAR